MTKTKDIIISSISVKGECTIYWKKIKILPRNMRIQWLASVSKMRRKKECVEHVSSSSLFTNHNNFEQSPLLYWCGGT